MGNDRRDLIRVEATQARLGGLWTKRRVEIGSVPSGTNLQNTANQISDRLIRKGVRGVAIRVSRV